MRKLLFFLLLCTALQAGAAPRIIYSIPAGSAPSASFGMHIDGRQLIVTEEGREDAVYELKRDRQMVGGRLDSILKLASEAQAAEVLNHLAPVQPAIEEEASRLPAEVGSPLQRFINIIALDGQEGVELRAVSVQAADAAGGSGSSKWLWAIGALVAGLAIGVFGAPLLYKRMKSGNAKGGRSRAELEKEIEKLEQRAEERDSIIADLRGGKKGDEGAETSTTSRSNSRSRDSKELQQSLEQTRKELDALQREKIRIEDERNQAITRAQTAEASLQQTAQNLRTAQRESQSFEERADRYDAYFNALLSRRVAPLYDRISASVQASTSDIAAELLALGWTTVSAARYFSPNVTATAVDRYNVSRLVPVDGELRTPAPISVDVRSGEPAVLLTMAEILRANGLQSIGDVSIENRRFEAAA